MTEISYHAEFVGNIDGDWVARTYRAYNDEGAPYVIGFDAGGLLLTLVQAPTEFLDGVEDEEADRENAITWVKALTEMAAKAAKWDAFQAEANELIAQVEAGEFEDGGARYEDDEDDDLDDWDDDEPVDLDYGLDDEVFVVDELGDDEVDQEWVDKDGDHYKNIDGAWYFSDGESPWETLHQSSLLRRFGPYRAVGAA